MDKQSPIHLLSFPEELLERIIEDVVLYNNDNFPSTATSATTPTNPLAPSRTLGPSPITTPSTTPKSTPSATRHVSPHASPVRSRPPSPVFPSALHHQQQHQRASITYLNGQPTHGSPYGSTTTHSTPILSGSTATATWAASASASTSVAPTANSTTSSNVVLAPLLTCHQLSRIALPLYYRVVNLKTRAQATTFLVNALGFPAPADATREGSASGSGRRDGGKRERARWIRRLVIGGVWKEAGEVIYILASLVPRTHPPLRLSEHIKGKGKAEFEENGEGLGGAGGPSEGTTASSALQVLEITIDASLPTPSMGYTHSTYGLPPSPSPSPAAVVLDEDAQVFAAALRAYAASWGNSSTPQGKLPTKNPLKHIVLRKPQNVYLTLPRAKNVIGALAEVVEAAQMLESAFVAFRMSDDASSTHPYHQQQSSPSLLRSSSLGATAPSAGAGAGGAGAGPITHLTSALASRPHLKTFTTMLPTVWNEAVLRVSGNEALERVVLLNASGVPVSPPPTPSMSGGSPPSNAQAGTRASPGRAAGGVPRPSATATARPRLSVVLPAATAANPVERVYASNARGVDGYHPSLSSSASSTSSSSSSYSPFTPHSSSYATASPASYHSGGGGLFMNQASRHERLTCLIRAGAGAGSAGREDAYAYASSCARRSVTVPVIAVPVPPASRNPALGPAGGASGASPSGSTAAGAGAGSSTTGTGTGTGTSSVYASCSSWFVARFSSSASPVGPAGT